MEGTVIEPKIFFYTVIASGVGWFEVKFWSEVDENDKFIESLAVLDEGKMIFLIKNKTGMKNIRLKKV